MPDQKMVYASMEDMAKSFDKGAQQIQDMVPAMAKIADQMEQGALKGQGGQVFQEALKETLTKKLNNIAKALTEMSADVTKAMAEMKSVEQQDTKMFKG